MKAPRTLERLKGLAEDLRRAAQSNDLDQLDGILAERQRLLSRLAEGAPAGDASARDLVLQEILELDRESQAALEKRGEAIREELVALDGGRRGLVGYRGPASRRSKWIDERG